MTAEADIKDCQNWTIAFFRTFGQKHTKPYAYTSVMKSLAENNLLEKCKAFLEKSYPDATLTKTGKKTFLQAVNNAMYSVLHRNPTFSDFSYQMPCRKKA